MIQRPERMLMVLRPDCPPDNQQACEELWVPIILETKKKDRVPKITVFSYELQKHSKEKFLEIKQNMIENKYINIIKI